MLQGPIEDTYAELMHWASFSDMFPAATTPALAAAVLWIAIQANQVEFQEFVCIVSLCFHELSLVGIKLANVMLS